jgi:hypothetical protein
MSSSTENTTASQSQKPPDDPSDPNGIKGNRHEDIENASVSDCSSWVSAVRYVAGNDGDDEASDGIHSFRSTPQQSPFIKPVQMISMLGDDAKEDMDQFQQLQLPRSSDLFEYDSWSEFMRTTDDAQSDSHNMNLSKNKSEKSACCSSISSAGGAAGENQGRQMSENDREAERIGGRTVMIVGSDGRASALKPSRKKRPSINPSPLHRSRTAAADSGNGNGPAMDYVERIAPFAGAFVASFVVAFLGGMCFDYCRMSLGKKN